METNSLKVNTTSEFAAKQMELSFELIRKWKPRLIISSYAKAADQL